MNINHIGVITLLTLKRVWNRKFALFTIVVSPIILCIAFGYVAHRSPENISTLIIIDKFESVPRELEMWQLARDIDDYRTEDGSKPFSTTAKISSRSEAMRILDLGQTRAVMVLGQGESGIKNAEVIIDVTEPSVYHQFDLELPRAVKKYSTDLSVQNVAQFLRREKNLPGGSALEISERAVNPLKITFGTNAWQELKFFDHFASPAIVLIALGLSLSLSAISITTERAIGTLERIFAVPYQKSEIIVGKMLSGNIIAIVMTILIIITLKTVFDATLGDIGLILLLTFLVAVNGVILGLLISAITNNETESLLLSTLFILFFILQMTYLWPWETMHPVARFISYLIPYTYGLQAIRHVNMAGAGFADVWLDVLILLGFIVVQAVISTLVLRREIK